VRVTALGGPAAGEARPASGRATPPVDERLDADVVRIAEAVRVVVGALATMLSRVVDDEWLEVMTVVGQPSAGIVEGLRWRRSDFESLLADAEQLGRIHATKHRTVTYVVVPGDTPETGRYVAHHLGLLLAPLHSADGDLVGVLATEGPVDIANPAPGACELVELYVDQARLALTALRHQDLLTELLRIDRYRRDLVASLTHDLKTPLTAIALNTELLESDRRLAEAGSHPVEAIRRSTDRLADLIDDLLALARAEEGADPLTEVDLVAMVRDACEHAETEAHLREVAFDIDTPEELVVTVDANALSRVFANLVGNAVKFSHPRGRVHLQLRRTGTHVEFRCRDEGIGIPAERLATLFDLSRRPADARIADVPGSGIGLAICQRIVTGLGGQISVESTQGEGSTFVVGVPC
jgi:signal transduction histidine kinase